MDKGIVKAAISRATRKLFFDKGSPIRGFCGALKHVMKRGEKNSAIDAEWEWCSLSLAKRKRPWERESRSRYSRRRLFSFFASRKEITTKCGWTRTANAIR